MVSSPCRDAGVFDAPLPAALPRPQLVGQGLPIGVGESHLANFRRLDRF